MYFQYLSIPHSGRSSSACMDSHFDDALVSVLPDLRTGLSLDDVLPRLERPAGGFMTKSEKIQVKSLGSPVERVSEIVGILREKTNDDFHRFLAILDQSGNEHWSTRIREKIYIGECVRVCVCVCVCMWCVCACVCVCTCVYVCVHAHTCICALLWNSYIRMIYCSPVEFNVKSFTLQHKAEFLSDVNTGEIVEELKRVQVISDKLKSKIECTPIREEANHLLLEHVCDNCDVESLRILCEVMVEEQGYPKMNALGRRMLRDLSTSYIGVCIGVCEVYQTLSLDGC